VIKKCARIETVVVHLKEREMKWETPRAFEFRFGMEITLYIARR